MLTCGTVVRPTTIIREIEHFDSSTSPARVATDAGEGFIKSMGNPMGSAALISELVAAELAAWFGLKIPPFAVIHNCSIEIVMKKNGRSMVAPLFFSSAVDGTPRDGSNTFLSKLAGIEDVASLVVFDTWIRNWDRCYNGDVNSDNLLYVQASRNKYHLTPIDHSNCFIGAEAEFPAGAAPENWIFDTGVYGKFPEFDQYITAKSTLDALSRLQRLDRAFVAEVVNSVPLEWGLAGAAKLSLIDFICSRAAYVVDMLGAQLIDEPELPGMM